MSAYHQYETQMKDPECITKALEDLGLHPTLHQDAVPLEGYHGDKRKETAEIVVPRKQVGSASNDIGLKKQADGTYKLIVSQYDRHRYGKAWEKKLTLRYGEHKAMKLAKKQGLRLKKRTEVVDPQTKQTKIRLEFAKRRAA